MTALATTNCSPSRQRYARHTPDTQFVVGLDGGRTLCRSRSGPTSTFELAGETEPSDIREGLWSAALNYVRIPQAWVMTFGPSHPRVDRCIVSVEVDEREPESS